MELKRKRSLFGRLRTVKLHPYKGPQIFHVCFDMWIILECTYFFFNSWLRETFLCCLNNVLVIC